MAARRSLGTKTIPTHERKTSNPRATTTERPPNLNPHSISQKVRGISFATLLERLGDMSGSTNGVAEALALVRFIQSQTFGTGDVYADCVRFAPECPSLGSESSQRRALSKIRTALGINPQQK